MALYGAYPQALTPTSPSDPYLAAPFSLRWRAILSSGSPIVDQAEPSGITAVILKGMSDG